MDVPAYCFDTDVLVDLLRGTEAVAARVSELPDDAFLCVTHIAIYELLRGAYAVGHADECQRVLHFIEQTLAADVLAAEWWAQLRAQGTPLPDADLIIAAGAMAAGATLVTRNHKHFSRIPSVRVECW